MPTEETKKRCDELVGKFKEATTFKYQEYAGSNYTTFEHDNEELVKCAILSTENTIAELEGLNFAMKLEKKTGVPKVNYCIAEQNEILAELKSRL